MANRADIAYHYDVHNDFYALILDRVHRAYSCAVWDNARTLEEAQRQKLARVGRFAGIQAGCRVMDVGCGWGCLLDYACDYLGASVATGLTLSEDQFQFIKAKDRQDITVSLQSWREYPSADTKYDAITAIGSFEHFASMEDRNAGVHRQVYSDFFEWCRAISSDNARVGLQSIVTSRPPETLQEVRDTRYLLERVFPGSALPSVSDIQAAIQEKYEIAECRRIGLNYARTLQEWRKRLLRHRAEIESRYGEELFAHYDHYFTAAERSFSAGITDLLQVSLRPARSVTKMLGR